MPPPPPPPVVLNPFRTPQHHLSHPRNHNNMNHMNGNLNNSSCSVSSSSSCSSSKDGTNSNIYSRHTKRWMLVLNSWIEHPMFRICYMMGITLLLICLMMVGYEAYQKFSNPITHSTSILMGPSSSSMSQFSITDSTADTTAVVLPGMVHENDEVIPEKIILPEILYKIPPKVSKMVGAISSSSSSSSSNVQHATVDGHDSGLRNNASSSSSSYQRTIDDDEIDDVEQKGTTTDRMSHVDSSTTKKVVATTTTDDNVEQILRPKEVHTKLLLGLATKDYLEAAILDEQEQNDRGFGGDINMISTDDTRNGRNDKGVMTTTSSQDHTQQQDLDRMVVVLPRRKGDELLKLPRIRSNNTTTNNNSSSNDNRNSVDETTTLTTNALPQPLSPPPPLQTDTELLLSPPERLSLPEELPLIAITHTVSVERSRRLRHSVVAIPTTPSSETNQSQLID